MDDSFMKRMSRAQMQKILQEQRAQLRVTKLDYAVSIVGAGILVSGGLLMRNGRRELQKLGNSPNKNWTQRPVKLCTTGVYQYTRHPVYLGAILLCIGLPMALHSTLAPLYRRKSDTYLQKVYAFWTLNSLAAFAFFDRVEIPREERTLRDTFGTKFTDYRDMTPKWIGFARQTYSDKRNTCNAGKASSKDDDKDS